jgi:alkylhydroperoxidase family enzyme
MEPRMTNPGVSVPGVMDALQALSKAANDAANAAGVPRATIELIGLGASQINGCSVCWTCIPAAPGRPA